MLLGNSQGIPRFLYVVADTVMYMPSPQPASAAPVHRVLVVDDEPAITELVATVLRYEGFQVQVAPTGRKALASVTSFRPHLVVLDVMLPDVDGFEVLRRVRADSDVPILMLTAKGDATDRVVGLELGADDYLPKPFSPRELLARLRAILRRRKRSSGPAAVLRYGRLEIDRGARAVRVDGEERPLTSYQFDLLVALAEHSGRVLSREALMDLVRGESLEAFDRSIDVHVSRIRSAIEDDPKKPRRIITVRGAGYVFARSQDGEA
jgi:two-component system, OmpR family, phosphate regulon response regulator OmpR